MYINYPYIRSIITCQIGWSGCIDTVTKNNHTPGYKKSKRTLEKRKKEKRKWENRSHPDTNPIASILATRGLQAGLCRCQVKKICRGRSTVQEIADRRPQTTAGYNT